MTDPIRYTILNNLKTLLAGITTGAGYNNTITTVELVSKGFDELTIRAATMPWIGIVSQEEEVSELSFGQLVIDWPIEILAHFEFTTKTHLGLAQACGSMRADLRKAIYSDPRLSDTIVMSKIVQMAGSEGAEEAIEKGLASVWIRLNVRFMEDVSNAY